MEHIHASDSRGQRTVFTTEGLPNHPPCYELGDMMVRVMKEKTSVRMADAKRNRRADMRARSNSIVKVEEVGNRSTEEVLDRSAFVNINADWVNAKGSFKQRIYNQKPEFGLQARGSSTSS